MKLIEEAFGPNCKSYFLRFEQKPIHYLHRFRNMYNHWKPIKNFGVYCNLHFIHRSGYPEKVALYAKSTDIIECHVSLHDEDFLPKTREALENDLRQCSNESYDFLSYCEREECLIAKKHCMSRNPSEGFFCL